MPPKLIDENDVLCVSWWAYVDLGNYPRKRFIDRLTKRYIFFFLVLVFDVILILCIIDGLIKKDFEVVFYPIVCGIPNGLLLTLYISPWVPAMIEIGPKKIKIRGSDKLGALYPATFKYDIDRIRGWAYTNEEPGPRLGIKVVYKIKKQKEQTLWETVILVGLPEEYLDKIISRLKEIAPRKKYPY